MLNGLSIAVGASAFPSFSGKTKFSAGYASLLQRLYPGKVINVSPKTICEIEADPKSLIIFGVVGETLVSTAQADLIRVEPDWNVMISNVITRDGYDGCGYGRATMEKLEQLARQLWGHARPLTFALTNNPKKGNAGFYKQLGYQELDTKVWAKA